MLDQRKYYYQSTSVNGNTELDYIKTNILQMELGTALTYTVTAVTENRPDLISNIHYNSYNFGWLIHLHNDIKDPLTEYHIGREIRIPLLDDYYQFYNRYANKV